MKSWRMISLGVVLVATFWTSQLFAADSTLGGGIDWPALADRVVVIAGIVFAVLQGIKKLFPALGGWLARVLSILLVVAGAYAVATPDQVLSVSFALNIILSWLGATGLHDALRRSVSGN